MLQRTIFCAVMMGCLVAVPAVLAQSSITCGPLDNGRVADVFYKSNGIFFSPVVEYEYEFAVLTISGPCENITKTFESGEEIFFDLAEVERALDGQYEWELRFMPAVDSGVRKELQASRGSGEEDDLWWSFWQKGLIPDGPSVDSAGFSVVGGAIIDPGSGEEEEGRKSATLANRSGDTGATSTSLAAAAAGFEAAGSPSSGTSETSGDGGPVLSTKDFVINDDLIVIGSTCIGFDCVNGEVFSFDTLRFRENNLRIKFDDTSGGSFPTRNWEIEINSSANGGQTHFRVNDVDAGRAPFTIEGSSPSHSLYVESSGDVGLGTSNPVVDLHVTDGDTPTLRLDQNTSSGFASQVWDVAGNETSFFVRDATNGSTLPFRIFPGASSNSLIIDDTNDIGIGTLSPDASLDVRRSGTAASLQGTSFSSGSADAPQYILRRARGSSGSPTAIASGDNLGLFSFRGHTGGGFSGSRALITAQATESWSGSANGTELLFSTTANGTSSPQVRFEIRENGDIFANGSLAHASSRTLKENFAEADAKDILRRVSELPITYWNYKKDDPSLRHIGPTAEDFHAMFEIGNDERSIAVNDSLGVALAAVKGLYETLEDKDQEISELKSRLEALEAALEEERR